MSIEDATKLLPYPYQLIHMKLLTHREKERAGKKLPKKSVLVSLLPAFPAGPQPLSLFLFLFFFPHYLLIF